MIKRLPDQITWDDLIYEFYVRSKIEMGMKSLEDGGPIPHEEIKKKYNVL